MSTTSPTRLLSLLVGIVLTAGSAVGQPYAPARQVCPPPEVLPGREVPGDENGGEGNELYECRRRVKELEEQLRKRDVLSGQLRQAEEDLSLLTRKNLLCTFELEEVEAARQRLAKENRRTKADLERSRAQVADLTGRITGCERDREKAAAVVASLQEQADRCERERTLAEEERDALRAGKEGNRDQTVKADWRWVAAAIGMTCVALLLLVALFYSRRRGGPLDTDRPHEQDVRQIDEADSRTIRAGQEVEVPTGEDSQEPREEYPQVAEVSGPALHKVSPVVPSPDDDSTEEVDADVPWSALLTPDSSRPWGSADRRGKRRMTSRTG